MPDPRAAGRRIRPGWIERVLRRRGWRKLDDLTLRDIAAVGHRYGIRFIPQVRRFIGPWQYDRRDGFWRRVFERGDEMGVLMVPTSASSPSATSEQTTPVSDAPLRPDETESR